MIVFLRHCRWILTSRVSSDRPYRKLSCRRSYETQYNQVHCGMRVCTSSSKFIHPTHGMVTSVSFKECDWGPRRTRGWIILQLHSWRIAYGGAVPDISPASAPTGTAYASAIESLWFPAVKMLIRVWFVALGRLPVVRNWVSADDAGPGTLNCVRGDCHHSLYLWKIPGKVPWSSPWRTTSTEFGVCWNAKVEDSVGVLCTFRQDNWNIIGKRLTLDQNQQWRASWSYWELKDCLILRSWSSHHKGPVVNTHRLILDVRVNTVTHNQCQILCVLHLMWVILRNRLP